MHYTTGEIIKIGDIINLADSPGKVVVRIEQNEAVAGYNAEDWAYLNVGVMLETVKYGLIHQIEADEDLELIRRNDSNT